MSTKPFLVTHESPDRDEGQRDARDTETEPDNHV